MAPHLAVIIRRTALAVTLGSLGCATLGLLPVEAQTPPGSAGSDQPRMRLSADGRSYVVFGGQLRERVEGWRGFDFGVPDYERHDDVFALTRVRLSADVRLGARLRVFGEAKSAFATNRRLVGGKRASDVDELELQQAYLELRTPARRGGAAASSARVGRQELAFGRERLVSALDWSNVRRVFDGISVARTRRQLTVTSFLVRPVRQEKYRLNPWDDHRAFYGLYATGAAAGSTRRTDLYWLGLSQDAATVNGTTGSERRQTVGLRLSGGGGARRGDYDLEAAYQFGRIGGATISAWMVSAEVGGRVRARPGSLRAFLGFDYASGDRAVGGSVQTFNQLFPLGHAYFGAIDLVGRQNILAASGGVRANVVGPLTLAVEGHRFWKASRGDALYRAAGTPVGRGYASDPSALLPPATSNDVGTELDVALRYAASRTLLVSGGYSRFIPGAWVTQTGPSKTVEFAYLALQYTM